MKKYQVRRYLQADYQAWNSFIGTAKNATFLFHRDFMEYHSDRFEDFSLMIFDNNKLVAVFPANRVGDRVFSHQGLTYGGLVYGNAITGERVFEMFDALIYFMRNESADLQIKMLPPWYNKTPTNEIDYYLAKNGRLLKREMNLAIDLKSDFSISSSKLKHFRRVSQLGMEIRQERDFSGFWNTVLIPRLEERFGAKPVHNLQEIKLLSERFPEQIHQFNVYNDENIVAGITIFDFGNGVKSQYGATTKEGEALRALDFLFINLIQKYKQMGYSFFDMGTVAEDNEAGYNSGLLNQKLELGCTIYNQDFYSITL